MAASGAFAVSAGLAAFFDFFFFLVSVDFAAVDGAAAAGAGAAAAGAAAAGAAAGFAGSAFLASWANAEPSERTATATSMETVFFIWAPS